MTTSHGLFIDSLAIDLADSRKTQNTFGIYRIPNMVS